MKLGFVSAILGELPLEEVLAFAADSGFSCVELMCWPVGRSERKYAGVTHVDVDGLTRMRAEDILAECSRSGVAISGLGYYPNLLDPDPAVAEPAAAHFRKVIEAAPLLGVGTVNGFVGRDWKSTVDDNWPRFLAAWKPIVRLAEERGVRIGIENCPMLFTRDEWPGGKNLFTTPAIWRRAFADLDSPAFGLNYDPSHFVLQDMDPLAPLAEFRDRLFHVHAKDVRIDRAALDEVGRFDFPLRWHQPRIPGHGEIDWGRFIGELRRVGYDGPVCIEVEDDTFGRSLEGRQLAVRVARNVLAPFVG
ncbi:MAG: sugar phosphate isomerase/epimerase [Planctomycetia bacterium]|nr:sugar phosphate isomerase/epimerase [Planctomycetia bacterium]